MKDLGATQEEWDRWSNELRLTDDLLPVVCRPGQLISPSSKVSDYGKVPSRYIAQMPDGRKVVIGIPKWTSHRATPDHIKQWRQEPDYGICLQTRTVRALDCDITDPEIAQSVWLTISRVVSGLPYRYRTDSSKFLVLFRLGGDYGKRTIRTQGGMIEFLADGQQCLVAGTHKQGARYEWRFSSVPEFIPTLTPEQFEDLFDTLVMAYATEEPTVARVRRKREPDCQSDEKLPNDPVLSFLQDKGLDTGTNPHDPIPITCPWKDQHTSDSGPTETVYFRAGTGGFETGNFRCLHAHCGHRTKAEFLDAIGYTLDGFEPVLDPQEKLVNGALAAFGIGDADDLIGQPPAQVPSAPSLWDAIPAESKNPSTSLIRAHPAAIEQALRRPDVVGFALEWDSFKDEIFIRWDGKDLRPLSDTDNFRIRVVLAKHKVDPKVPKELVRDAVEAVAEDHTFDSAQRWLDSFGPWDGIPRVERFYETYLGAEKSPYNRACGLYLWTALAGRIITPGEQCDMVPIWRSTQGTRKTSAVLAIVGDPDLYELLDFNKDDDELMRLTRGKLIAELAELRGLKSRDSESIKSYITRRVEHYRPLYHEETRAYKRRFIMVGTTNQGEFLVDETGNRRFLPTDVGLQDIEAIEWDRGQLWAEGAEIYRHSGIAWQAAEELAKAEHHRYEEFDEWRVEIDRWLNAEDIGGKANWERQEIRLIDIAIGALGMSKTACGASEQKRIGACLRKMGWEVYKKRSATNAGVNRYWRATWWKPASKRGVPEGQKKEKV